MERDRVAEAQSWFDEAKVSNGEKRIIGMQLAQTELLFKMVELLEGIDCKTNPPEIEENKVEVISHRFGGKTIELSIPSAPLGVENSNRLRQLADELDRVSSPIVGTWLRSIATAIDGLDIASSA